MILEKFEEAVRDYEKAKQIDHQMYGINEKIKHAKLELKKSKRKDYYKILNVAKEAGEDEVKKAYRKQALIWHPDKNSSTEEEKNKATVMFKDIGEAYSVISDPKKR